MKRLITLTTLLVCSLIVCSAAAQGQTWRLTNDAFSDSLPKITIDNAGRVWVAWLSDAPGNYDVYCRKFESAVWGDTFRVHADDSSQNYLDVANDASNNRVWIAWDSIVNINSKQIQTAYYQNDTLQNTLNIIDSLHSLEYVSGLSLQYCDTGKIFTAWSASDGATISGYLRQYENNIWDTIQTVLPGYESMLGYRYEYVKRMIIGNNGIPYVVANADHYSMGGITWFEVDFAAWNQDSGWIKKSVATTPIISPLSNYLYTVAGALCSDYTILLTYTDSLGSGQRALMYKKYDPISNVLDSADIIQCPAIVQSGATDISTCPTLAWSDSHSIFLNTYYDTIWSHPPVQISDPGLYNCINPDIVAENDSTVWVCYQNDGDIYVTRTQIPLGVAGNPNTENRIPKPINLKSWPNPANNVIHFSYTLPAKQNSSVSIYDIAGRLVKTLEISENQTDWNCADHAGRRVASGVYFARLKSDGQETIRKISVIH